MKTLIILILFLFISISLSFTQDRELSNYEIYRLEKEKSEQSSINVSENKKDTIYIVEKQKPIIINN